MDLAYIKKIIRLVEKSEIDEIEIEEEGKKIRVAKSRNSSAAYQIPFAAPTAYPGIAPAGHAESAPGAAPVAEAPVKKEVQYHEIRSPIVGTFYGAPAPEAEPYVVPGQTVQRGTVLCIVEAMKLMNEIESDLEGRVVKCLVENGKPVEYNQVLFWIEPV